MNTPNKSLLVQISMLTSTIDALRALREDNIHPSHAFYRKELLEIKEARLTKLTRLLEEEDEIKENLSDLIDILTKAKDTSEGF